MSQTNKKKSPEISRYILSDRSIDDNPIFLDVPIDSSTSTVDLIEYWFELRNKQDVEKFESAEWKALENAYLNHLIWRFTYHRKIYSQRLVFSWIITSLVIILVVAGLIFSFIQLEHALTIGNLTSMETELSIQSAGNLSFRSSVIGALSLIVSTLFYYLYLRYVLSAQHLNPSHIALTETDAMRLFTKAKEIGDTSDNKPT